MSQSKSFLPQHVAIIMDGNRRWARQQGLGIIKGHRKVAQETIEKLADHCIKRGISYLTLWAFSTENWSRPEKEVGAVMSLFRESFKTSAQRLHSKGIKVQLIGDMSRFPKDIQESVKLWVVKTKNNNKLTVTMALNYGGRDDIVRAVKKMMVDSKTKDEIDEPLLSQYLDTKNLPDPDLVIRPGGEKRLSGFLAWQSVYAELYFTNVLMPDFNEKELDKALAEYKKRQRRFGR